MNKIFVKIAVLILFLMITTGYTYSHIVVTVDGEEIEFNEQPVIINGKPVLPLWTVLEALGVKLRWDNNGRVIRGTKDDISIKLTVNSRYAYVNGREIILERPVIKKNGFPMISIDFISEGLRAKTDWNPESKKLMIDSINDLKVHFIDVEQGEAIFIDYDNYDILIDCGSKEKGEIVADYLKHLNTDDIEILVLTHNDEEHIGGLKDIFSEFKVENVIADFTWKNDIDTVKEGTNTRVLQDKDMEFDLGFGVRFSVIETGDNYDNIDNNSVVTLLTHNDVKFLFTGDMESDVEKKNIDKFTDIEILKVANHGGKISTSELFLDKVKPQIAVISTGDKEKCGYPDEEAINSLEKRNIDVYSTWDYGSIIITTDGLTYNIDNCSITGIEIIGINFYDRKILLKNLTNKTFEMSGCKVTDRRGYLTFYIPEESTLKPQNYAIFDLIEDNINNEDKKIYRYSNCEIEKGILYDSKGNKIAE